MVIGDTVPALVLFVPTAGRPLTKLTVGGLDGATLPLGELRRFSVNPLLEAAAPSDSQLKSILRDYRSLIYRKLYELSLQLFWAQAVHFVHGIATPEIYRFFMRSGMTMCLLAGTGLVNNEEVRMIQRDFALYWRPHAPLEQQPALYRDPDDPTVLTVTHQFADLAAASAFAGWEELRSAMMASGVEGVPDIWFAEDVEQTAH